MVRYLFYTIGDLTYQSPLVVQRVQWKSVPRPTAKWTALDFRICYIVCPTLYRNRHFFNNSNTNEDIAKKFEQEYVHCVRNETECVCYVCLQCA